MSMEHPSVPPPPPPPPLLPPPPPPPPPEAGRPSECRKKKLYQAIAEGKTPVVGDHEEALSLLRQRGRGFRKDLQWLLLNKYVPSLIQDGPQCGLVALWMASQLLQPTRNISLDVVLQTALAKRYTAQGEMFSAKDMACLAEEVCDCKAELVTGGMDGINAPRLLRHLTEGQPVLIPYDEDFNHEPCQRRGHRAHWAVASGILVGLAVDRLDTRRLRSDPSLPWVFMPDEAAAPPVWAGDDVQDLYVLAKQGKSLRYQLWRFGTVSESNGQLKEMDPHRATDGTSYVLPPGGVAEGLAGQVVLLHTKPALDNPMINTQEKDPCLKEMQQ